MMKGKANTDRVQPHYFTTPRKRDALLQVRPTSPTAELGMMPCESDLTFYLHKSTLLPSCRATVPLRIASNPPSFHSDVQPTDPHRRKGLPRWPPPSPKILHRRPALPHSLRAPRCNPSI